MDLLLREEAVRAQDVAEIFSILRNNDPEHEQDITLAITGLNGLIWALRELERKIDAVGGRLTKTFAADLKLLQTSVAFTLQVSLYRTGRCRCVIRRTRVERTKLGQIAPLETRAFADLAFCCQDVWTILGRLPRPATSTSCKNAWKEIVRYCMTVGGQNLDTRLKTYEHFTYELCKILKR
jgi:hypothetical protein